MAPRKPKVPRSAGPDPGRPDPANPDVNPYVAWACGLGKPHYFPPGPQDGPGKDKRLTLLVQLQGISAREFVAGDSVLKKGDSMRRAWRQTSFVIPFPGAPTFQLDGKQTDWLLAFASPEVTDLIASAGPKRHVASVGLGRPLGNQSAPLSGFKPPEGGFAAMAAKLAKLRGPIYGPTTPGPVFMGVIDDGIAFANERFRVMDGIHHRTRVQDWWMMDTNIALTKPSIDNLFDLCTNGDGVLDEDVFYRRAGLIDFTNGDHKAAAWRVTHGTHVMDAACGYAPSDNRLDRPIACVQLPLEVTADVDNGDLYPFFVAAVSFIIGSMLDYAFENNMPPLPVVINFSYGRLEGPHDGSSPIEKFIEWITGLCALMGFPLRFVLPAGNSFLARTHAQMTFTSLNQVKKVNWHVLPDDQSESFVEIWTPRIVGPNSRLTLTVKDPLGGTYSIDENTPVVLMGPPYGWLIHRVTPTRGVFYIQILPTASLVPGQLAPSGTYEIQLKRTGGLAATDIIDAWVARDDTIPGYPQFGRQSYLDDALYEYRNIYSGRAPQVDNRSLVQRQCTINAIATGASPIVIGGFLRKEMEPAFYSAAGARMPRPLPPRAPDAMAPSEDSEVLEGRLAAGSHSGARVPVAGTSVAAPQIARWVADDLSIGNAGDRARVQWKAAFDEVNAPPGDPPPPPPPPFSPPPPPAERGGSGRIWSKPLNKVKRYEW